MTKADTKICHPQMWYFASAPEAPFLRSDSRKSNGGFYSAKNPFSAQEMSGSFWGKIDEIVSTKEVNVETWLVLPFLDALGYDRDYIESRSAVFFQEGVKKRYCRADLVVYPECPFSRSTCKSTARAELLTVTGDRIRNFAQLCRSLLGLCWQDGLSAG